MSQGTRTELQQEARFDQVTQLTSDDPNVAEMQQHNDNVVDHIEKVPVFVMSPMVNLIWLYLCPMFRKAVDFNFHRAEDWTDDTRIVRFNDCLYTQKHFVFDKHNFALLNNEAFLVPQTIAETNSKQKFVVQAIKYQIPTHIRQATKSRDFSNSDNNNFWKSKNILSYKKLIEHDHHYTLESKIFYHKILPTDDVTTIDRRSIAKPILNENGETVTVDPQYQHNNVANNNPHFFIITGCDKYHHTTFTGKRDWGTNGLYWWLGNMDPRVQFKIQMTMMMAQIPSSVSTTKIGQISWSLWNELQQDGMMLWDGTRCVRTYANVSHKILDMVERDHYSRRRSNNKKSRCDGMLWLGYYQGCGWPQGVNNLMELGTITPGPYLLKIWKFLHYSCIPLIWTKLPESIGRGLTLTNATTDIYNEQPVASSLKCTVELNHTTLLGCLSQAFNIEWYRLHMKGNCNRHHTRQLLSLYLQKYFHNINGMTSLLIQTNTKINVFNQMKQAWQKMIEVLIALPVCSSWFGNVGLLISFIRICGTMFTIETKNARRYYQQRFKTIINKSYVVHLL